MSACICRTNQNIRVKLSGDGTTVGKRIHCVVFSFILLDEEETVASVDGIHPIVLVREPESYEALSLSLADVITEVEVLGKEGIFIGGIFYKVHTYIDASVHTVRPAGNPLIQFRLRLTFFTFLHLSVDNFLPWW